MGVPSFEGIKRSGVYPATVVIRQGQVIFKDLLDLSLPRNPIPALATLSWDRVSRSSGESAERPSGRPVVSEAVRKADMKEAVADLEPDDVEKFDVQKYDDGVSLLVSADGDEITYLWFSAEDAQKLADKLKAKSKADTSRSKSKADTSKSKSKGQRRHS
jgi:hypothetical protein